jgi:hypothetical protein
MNRRNRPSPYLIISWDIVNAPQPGYPTPAHQELSSRANPDVRFHLGLFSWPSALDKESMAPLLGTLDINKNSSMSNNPDFSFLPAYNL